jgi:polyvinyl alcohol dehydrogenase (cytochrome)
LTKARVALRRAGTGVLAAALLLPLAAARGAAQSPDWPMAGQGLTNTRHQPAETAIGAHNAARLRPRWVFTMGGDASATPAVAGGALYVPDWEGNLFKVDTATGAALWTRRIADYTGDPATFARATPALAGGVLYVGTQKGAHLLAVDSATGDLAWKTLLDPHEAASVTQSAVVHGGRVYVGVSSDEELVAAVRSGYQCCTFRGSVVALDASTGAVVWRAYTTPENGGAGGGFSGVAVWGSTPVVDPQRGSLYVTTGNNYSVPPGADALRPDNHVDAVVALDLATGALKWSARLQGPDAWNAACTTWRRRQCPDPKGPDYDFAQGPMLFTAATADGPRTLLAAGQKSGVFWALDPGTGAVVWSTMVGPAGGLGGMMWGSATDGTRVYAAAANSFRAPFTLVPSGETTRGGAWSALDAATGAILWQTAVPRGGVITGPVTVANGVLYGGSMTRRGKNMFALDAATGAILWGFASGGSVNSGPAIAGGVAYWPSGYSKLGLGKGNDKLYAFEVAP